MFVLSIATFTFTLHYTYDFVESALLLKQLMYVTIRETFETQSSQRGLYSGILTWFLQSEASWSQDATFPVIIVETPTDYFTLCLSSLTSKTFITKRTHETSTKKKTTTTIVGRNKSTRKRLSLSCVFRSVSANYDRDCSGAPARAKRAWDRAPYPWNMVNQPEYQAFLEEKGKDGSEQGRELKERNA